MQWDQKGYCMHPTQQAFMSQTLHPMLPFLYIWGFPLLPTEARSSKSVTSSMCLKDALECFLPSFMYDQSGLFNQWEFTKWNWFQTVRENCQSRERCTSSALDEWLITACHSNLNNKSQRVVQISTTNPSLLFKSQQPIATWCSNLNH